MGKKIKKKKVRDHLAKKRGKRKIKKKILPPKSKSKKVDTELINKMMLATIPLADIEELRDIKFDNERLTNYLESAKQGPEQKPIDFIRKGIQNVITVEFFNKVRERFVTMTEKGDASEQLLLSVDAYFKLLSLRIYPEYIPLFVILFANQVKRHPLADSPKIWKYIMDFLPKKVVSPEEEKTLAMPELAKTKEKEEKRDERYPHIILPK